MEADGNSPVEQPLLRPASRSDSVMPRDWYFCVGSVRHRGRAERSVGGARERGGREWRLASQNA